MSYCTFLGIKGNEAKLQAFHYSTIKDIIQGRIDFVYFHNSIYGSDTDFVPAFVVNFNTHEIVSTNFNWFINLTGENGAGLENQKIWKEKKSGGD